MSSKFYKKDKGTTFQEIIWKTLEAIREKSSLEYRTPQEKMVLHSNWSEKIIEGDSRKESIQLIEFLSDILIQEFDEDTLNEYNRIMKIISEMRKKTDLKEMDNEDYVVEKLFLMRELFRKIMFLLKEKEYFKGFGGMKLTEEEEEDSESEGETENE